MEEENLFILPVMSTMPLQFLWNSAVFTTTQQLDYNVFVVTPNFFNQSTVDCSQNVLISGYQYGQNLAVDYISWPTNFTSSNYQWYHKETCSISNYLLANSSQNLLTRLSDEDCINTYGPGNKRLSKWGNILAVAKVQPASSNNTIL